MSDTIKKKISIGVEDFKRIIDKNGYFVDKTLMIQKLIESEAMVTLFTRPRRFGKTLNQFMIRRFFEDEITEKGEKVDNGYLFDGLKITECGEEIMKHSQQYPVIFLTLKSAKQPTYELAYAELKKRIYEEFDRHQYVLGKGVLSKTEELRFQEILSLKAEEDLYTDALGFLSKCLFKYHGKNTIILIDEYDVPLENAYFEGFYDKMIKFIRSLFESALKTNPYLEKSVITGCLRISKESIFTGLNNLETDSVLHTRYGDSFGFTQEEVEELLAYYGLSEQLEEVKQWYDGYLFNHFEIYNPWSLLKYVNDRKDHVTEFALPYWSNTSSNSIVREMVGEADEDAKRDLETLINGGTIEKQVHEDITYGDIHQTQDNLWNFLFFTGYLKKVGERKDGNNLQLQMKIPNIEIATIYENSISYWFDQRMKKTDRSPLKHALEEGDCEAAADFINRQLADTISFYDYAENFYHGFMAGLLVNIGGYSVKSNRESGNGRPDIVMQTANIRKGRVIILELKIAGSIAEMEAACDRGLAQIEEQHYAEPFTTEGYPEVKKYALSFYKKECMVKKAE
ncbi:putative uncharacterized protein [Firmicutes bacterium CAG:238]|nr:putative uncharacterized protein [Firmicutes bacterium CAG:238]